MQVQIKQIHPVVRAAIIRVVTESRKLPQPRYPLAVIRAGRRYGFFRR